MKITSATHTTGHLLRQPDGTYDFRVYGENNTFTDYHLVHYDLVVTIVDKDSAFYSAPGYDRLDHSPTTLGIEP